MDQNPSVGHEHKDYTSDTDHDSTKNDDDDDEDDDNFEDDREDEYQDDHAGSDGSYITNDYEKPDPAGLISRRFGKSVVIWDGF